MGLQARKKMHKKDKSIGKKFRTKNRKKDLDQILEDLAPYRAKQLLNPDIDPDLPGLGQKICVHCSRYFIDETSMQHHFKSKLHKKRVKKLRQPMYTQQEADAAGGIGVYKPPPKPSQFQAVLLPSSAKDNVTVNLEGLSISN